MNNEEFLEYAISLVENKIKEVESSKKEALNVLVKAGVCTEKGELRNKYKETS